MDTKKIVNKWIRTLIEENNMDILEDLKCEVLEEAIQKARQVINNPEKEISNELMICYIVYANHLQCVLDDKKKRERRYRK